MVNGDYLLFSRPLIRLLLPIPPSSSSHPVAAYGASVFIKATVLPPRPPKPHFFHALAFCHTSPPNIDPCSALHSNLCASELKQ